jgi:hypothetical protein
MQVKDLASALSMDDTFIGKAIRGGHLSACMMRGSGHGRKMRYRITRSNALLWVWRNEHGSREMLTAAMQLHCPKLLNRILATPATAEPFKAATHAAHAAPKAAAKPEPMLTPELDLFR